MSASMEQMSQFLQDLNRHKCVLDEQQYVDKKHWAITLIRDKDNVLLNVLRDKHVIILYEGCDNEGKYFVKIVHLKAESNVPLANLPFRCGEFIKESDLTKAVLNNGSKAIRYAEKTPTYVLQRTKVELMIAKIEQTKDKVTFDLLGRHSFFNMTSRFLGCGKDSCHTYAINTVYHAGLKFPTSNSGMVAYTDSVILNNSVKMEPYDISDLGKLAKEGAVKLIKETFPFSTNVNQLVDFPYPEGPVEVFLGHYTPLAIAVAYNQFEVVKLLCEKYKANVNLLSGRWQDHTALDCANRDFWWAPNAKAKEEIKEYLLKRDAKLYSELKTLNKIEENMNTEIFRVKSFQQVETSSPAVSEEVRLIEARAQGKIAKAELEQKGSFLLMQSKAAKRRARKKAHKQYYNSRKF